MILPFARADRLTDEIMAFLIECGGPYGGINGGVQENILLALATGQYVLGGKDGEISYFASYWKIRPEDMTQIRQMKRPKNITAGPVMYVSECGSKSGMQALSRRLRHCARGMQSACWHRGDVLKTFSLQKEK